MKFEILSKEEFTDFVDNHYTKNFFQTTMMQDRMEKDGIETYLVGVKKIKK